MTLLESRLVTTDIALDKAVSLKKFIFYDDLAFLLSRELKRGHDAVIHAAAVSDFRLATPFQGKLPSGRALKLELVPTRKLLTAIRKADPRVFLVGFKLETRLARPFILRKVKSLFREAGCGLVVVNRQAAGRYEACLVEPSGKMSKKVFNKRSIVKVLAAKVDKII